MQTNMLQVVKVVVLTDDPHIAKKDTMKNLDFTSKKDFIMKIFTGIID